MKQKRCIVCCQLLSLEQFPTNRRMPDGHLNWCYGCFEQRGGSVPQPVPLKRKKPRREPKPVCVRVDGLVAYDKDDRPINPGKHATVEQRKAYHRAYTRWNYAIRKQDEAFMERRRGYYQAYKQWMQKEGKKYDWKKYYRTYRERHPERYAEANERAKERYRAKKMLEKFAES